MAVRKTVLGETLSALTLGACLVAAYSVPAAAQQRSTEAAHAIILDASTGTILLDKDSDEAFPPASMSKLMTVYMAFDAIRHGELKLTDTVRVSDEAWRNWNNRGSTMFLRARDEVTVGDLLRGIIVLSGNDACVVLAEHMAGSEATFVGLMNEKAKELGMTGSHFVNSNGWPADGHEMTARDLAKLSLKLVTEFPDLYPIFAEREFLYKDFKANRYNRNPLLGRFPGADGLKTGHTEEAGYGLAASAERDGRRIVMVIAGLDSQSARTRESASLMQYAFRNFSNYPLFRAGETVDHAEVWLGSDATVPLTIGEDIFLTLSRRERSNMTVSISYTNPMPAPLAKGQKVGALTVALPDKDPMVYDLLAGADVAEVGGFGRIGAALDYLVFGSAGQEPSSPAGTPE